MDKVTSDYRIIHITEKNIPWYGVYEVYYHNDTPIDHSVAPVGLFGDMEDILAGINDFKDALNKPILKDTDFPPVHDHRRGEWMQTKNAIIVPRR
jgi:hypothetical protein